MVFKVRADTSGTICVYTIPFLLRIPKTGILRVPPARPRFPPGAGFRSGLGLSHRRLLRTRCRLGTRLRQLPARGGARRFPDGGGDCPHRRRLNRSRGRRQSWQPLSERLHGRKGGPDRVVHRGRPHGRRREPGGCIITPALVRVVALAALCRGTDLHCLCLQRLECSSLLGGRGTATLEEPTAGAHRRDLAGDPAISGAECGLSEQCSGRGAGREGGGGSRCGRAPLWSPSGHSAFGRDCGGTRLLRERNDDGRRAGLRGDGRGLPSPGLPAAQPVPGRAGRIHRASGRACHRHGGHRELRVAPHVHWLHALAFCRTDGDWGNRA